MRTFWCPFAQMNSQMESLLQSDVLLPMDLRAIEPVPCSAARRFGLEAAGSLFREGSFWLSAGSSDVPSIGGHKVDCYTTVDVTREIVGLSLRPSTPYDTVTELILMRVFFPPGTPTRFPRKTTRTDECSQCCWTKFSTKCDEAMDNEAEIGGHPCGVLQSVHPKTPLVSGVATFFTCRNDNGRLLQLVLSRDYMN